MLVLNVIQGPDKGMQITLPDTEPQLIGRSSEAIVLSDQTISRRHAELTPDGDGTWHIRVPGYSGDAEMLLWLPQAPVTVGYVLSPGQEVAGPVVSGRPV